MSKKRGRPRTRDRCLDKRLPICIFREGIYCNDEERQKYGICFFIEKKELKK